MKIAAAYIRVSTDRQTELSPDSQIKQIREYAKRHDMIVPDEFVFADEGITGTKTDKREGFKKMIGVAKKKPKPFEAILLWKFSRFARNRQDSIIYKSMLRKDLGIDVISISEDIGDNKMAVLFEAQIEAMDEYYSINLAEEVKRGMVEKVSRGGAVAGPAFGYNMQNKEYVINSNESEYVKMIFNDYLAGLGTREIATKLNNLGVLTKRGGLWENRTIEYILRNPVYIGKIRWNPSKRTRRKYNDESIMLVDGTHENIIDLDTFKAVNLKLDKTKNMYAKYARTDSPTEYMLRGLVRCSACGSTLTLSNDGVQCHAYAKGKCHESHYINLPALNKLVLETITTVLMSGDFNIKMKSKANINNEFLLDDIEREKNKLLRVKEAYEAGIDTLEEYKENKAKLLKNIAELENKKVAQTIMIPDKKEFIRRNLKVLERIKNKKTNEKSRNHLLRTFVDDIIFYRDSCSVDIVFYS